LSAPPALISPDRTGLASSPFARRVRHPERVSNEVRRADEAGSGARDGLRVGPERYRRLTLFAVVALAVIIVTGATVRLTGSGLGCSDWPNCEDGQLAAQVDDAPAMIEFVNRLVTGVVSLAVILAVLGALRRVPYRRDLTVLAWGLVFGVVVQILLGALVVEEALSPKFVMAHFLVSLVLVWNALVLHARAGDDGRRGAPSVLGWAALAGAAIVVFTGTIVTASGPHAGDVSAERLGFHIEDVARVHGIAVVAFAGFALWVWRATRAPAAARLVAVIAAQAAVGYAQYFTGVPALLVGVHVVGAVLVWCATVALTQALRPAVALDADARLLAHAG
jgi:cytochrome c oxidase assembly protein subunit 15